MVAGHLSVKNGKYYAVLNYKNAKKERKSKWISLGLPEKGNKRKAEGELARLRAEFEVPEEVGDLSSDMLMQNVADKVDRPKKNSFQPVFLSAEEMQRMFEALRGTKLELPVLVAAFYGFRRGEVVGLKLDAIDFERNTITIRHTVTSCDLDGKRILVASDTTKTKSSMRTLPLVPFMRERLLALKEEQQENRCLCGRSYIKDYLEYVCVNEIGHLIKPHYVTESFPKLLKANGMRQIRYHDLRHNYTSLLLTNNIPIKQIQKWLGHSDFSTTANIYAHLDYSSKLTSADAMLNGLSFAAN